MIRMDTNAAPQIRPPRMINSIAAGFNTVTGHLYLILFPIALDLLLWFGPRLRIKTLLAPVLVELNQTLNAMSQPEIRELLAETDKMWNVFTEHFNLVSTLRSLPVGVPSLMAASAPLAHPLGNPVIYETPTFGAAFSAWLLFGLIGITLGSFYFNLLARATSGQEQRSNAAQVIWQTMQTVALFIIMVFIVLAILLPVSFFLTMLTAFSPALTQFAILLISIFLIWLLLPLFFSPHGVFAFQLDALRSALVSYRLVRFFLPGTALFLLLSLLISQGLDILWRIPEDNSWMALVGVIGHAFVSTGLVASSFFYYYGGIRWMQETMRNIEGKARVD